MSKKTLLKVKNYWNRKPCNIEHSKKKFLTKAYFDEIREKKYFAIMDYFKFCEF